MLAKTLAVALLVLASGCSIKFDGSMTFMERWDKRPKAGAEATSVTTNTNTSTTSTVSSKIEDPAKKEAAKDGK